MELIQLNQELYQTSKRLEGGGKDIFRMAREMAIAEKEYRKALAIEKIRLREEKMPVGLIEDVARGNLSELRYKRDLAKETYIAGRDSLKAIQMQISALQTIIRYQSEV